MLPCPTGPKIHLKDEFCSRPSWICSRHATLNIRPLGPNACEIFLLLFAFFIEDPDCMVITRGNHEEPGGLLAGGQVFKL